MQLTVEATAADRAIAAATVVAAASAGKIPSIDGVTAASTSIHLAQRVRGLRVKLSQLCMHRQPIVLAPSLYEPCTAWSCRRPAARRRPRNARRRTDARPRDPGQSRRPLPSRDAVQRVGGARGAAAPHAA